MWVNGRLVSRGPDDPGFDEILSQDWSHQWLYNQVDLAPYLHAGQNVIAAEVLTTHLSPSYTLHHSGFAFEVSLLRGSTELAHIASDSSWETQPVTAYSDGPILNGALPVAAGKKPEDGLYFDARLEDPAWRSAENTPNWKRAQAVDSIWGPLRASRLPGPMEAAWPIRKVDDQTANLTRTGTQLGQDGDLRLTGDGSFSVQFDRVLSAYASFRVKGTAGTVVTIQTAETKADPNPRRSAQIILRDGETVFEHPVYDAFSIMFVTVSHSAGPTDFSDIRADFVSQPVTYRGSFSSSDEALNKLWEASRWQTQICMQNHYLDSPNHQEPIGDFGDYLIEAMENDYAFDAQALTEQDLRKFAEVLDHAGEVNFHTSYSMLWLQMLMEYYDYTGDAALLHELKPTVDRLLDHWATFKGANGLLSEAPTYMFMDWVTIAGFPAHHPPAVIGQGYLTAFYYKGLEDGARLAEIEHDSARSAHYEQQRSEIRAAFERELWDPVAGLYRDGKPHQNHQPLGKWLPEDRVIETHSTHVNTLAVLYDLAPRDRQAAIMDRLNARPAGLNVQPYFMHFVFSAEAHADVLDRYAVAQMHQWTLNPETQTFSEMFGQGDFSHGWGGTPLIQMSARILGVTPALPGYKKIRVQPHASGLQNAKGVVPTPDGDVTISWTSSPGRFVLDMKSPSSEPVMLALPGMNEPSAIVEVNGRHAPRSGDLTAPLSLASGSETYHVEVRTSR